MSTVTEPKFVRINGSETAPACFLRGWVPDVEVFPELTEARSEWLRLDAALNAAGARRRELEEVIEGAKVKRAAALKDALLAGEPEPQADAEDNTLVAELAAAKEQGQAAATALVECINRTIALVIEHYDEWQGSITEFERGVDGEVEALLAQARTLRLKRGNFFRLQHWLQRTGVQGADMPAYHHPFSEIAPPPSGDPLEEAERDLERTLKSYAGGIAPDRPATEEQAREVARRNEAARTQKPVEVEVELSELEDDDLVDWLMGTGMFDSEPRPTADEVVAAAEGDAAMAARLRAAEITAGGDAPRQAVLDGLNEITKGIPA
jgi:hypothetical protein